METYTEKVWRDYDIKSFGDNGVMEWIGLIYWVIKLIAVDDIMWDITVRALLIIVDK